MAIRLRCKCGLRRKLPDAAAGCRTKCPRCSCVARVPTRPTSRSQARRRQALAQTRANDEPDFARAAALMAECESIDPTMDFALSNESEEPRNRCVSCPQCGQTSQIAATNCRHCRCSFNDGTCAGCGCAFSNPGKPSCHCGMRPVIRGSGGRECLCRNCGRNFFYPGFFHFGPCPFCGTDWLLDRIREMQLRQLEFTVAAAGFQIPATMYQKVRTDAERVSELRQIIRRLKSRVAETRRQVARETNSSGLRNIVWGMALGGQPGAIFGMLLTQQHRGERSDELGLWDDEDALQQAREQIALFQRATQFKHETRFEQTKRHLPIGLLLLTLSCLVIVLTLLLVWTT